MPESKLEKNLGLSIRKEELITQVLLYVKNEGLTYSEAIIEVCEERQIEPEDIAQLITGPLKEKLRLEAMSLNIIPNKGSNKPNGYIENCT